MNILLIAGGWSSEREVSLAGARGMRAALEGNGHTVTFLDPATDFDRIVETAAHHDFAMLNLHGTPGEDGLIQAMLDSVHCPYEGAGPSGSFLAVNKAAAKQVFRHAGLPTPDWEYLPVRPGEDWQPSLPYPLFVKSNTGGSSLHLGRAGNRKELFAIVNDIFDHCDTALVERAVAGQDITCAVLGDRALPPILIQPMKGDYFDFESKYASDGARELCPAPVDAKVTADVQAYTVAACAALGLDGYGRADFILAPDGRLSLLEVNTLPGMTPTSLVPKEAAAVGMDFPALLEALIRLGIERSAARTKK